jgi:choline monooxygenase
MTDRVADEVLRFDPDLPLESAGSPPSSWYTDPGLYALEQSAVFGRRWVFACRSSEVSAPGSFASGCHGGSPWVVARDTDGTLRAFHNVCRHRGAEVVQGNGSTDSLTCRYHGWVYRLDGRLRSAPRMGSMAGFDRDTMSLPPMQVVEWGPLVMINADPDARPFLDDFGELDAILSATGWQHLTPGARKVWDVDCNWKVFADNYLDGGYHIAHMHPTLDAQLDMASYRTDLYAWFSVQTSRPDSSEDPRAKVDVAQRMGVGPVYAWLYPSLMINRYGPVLDTNVVVPIAADRCQVVFDFWFDPSVSDAFIAESLEQSDVTQREDIDVSESVQRGTASASFDRGRYASAWEKGIHHFHSLLAGDLRAALGR